MSKGRHLRGIFGVTDNIAVQVAQELMSFSKSGDTHISFLTRMYTYYFAALTSQYAEVEFIDTNVPWAH